ncbi:unnamed protein product, partial [Ostreobium quekettii]
EAPAVEEETPDVMPSSQGESAIGAFFGNYLQLAVWAAVLGLAGYTAVQKIGTDPESLGILVGPPAVATVLIVTFAIYKLTSESED